MAKLELPKDFVEYIWKGLGWIMPTVEEAFEFTEDKQGHFIAQLKQGRSLNLTDFKTVCAVAKDLGGDYVRGKRRWVIPGPCVKKEEAPAGSQPESAPEKEPTEESKPPEPESPRVQPSDEYFLAKSIMQVGYLYPVLKDANGNVIDGYHRLDIDPEWPVKKVDEVRDPVQLAIARLIANVCRRDVPAEEKTEWLGQIAELTGWAPKQIAASLPVSYTWVMKYLPDEYKERPGVGPSEYPVTRRVTEQQFVPCARCGVATSEPVHLDGKFYCANCAEKIVEDARRGITVALGGSFEEEPTTGYPSLPSEHGTASRSEVGLVEEQPRPEEIDTGFEWECPECHQKFQLIHVEYPYGQIKHKFERKKEVES